MEIFSKRLKALREKYNMTQQDIASKLGISQSYYSKFEYNTREPNLETVLSIADIFDCSLDYLLGRDKYSPVVPDLSAIKVITGLHNREFTYGEETFPLPSDVLKGNEGVMFEIKDESMVGSGMLPGDSAIVALDESFPGDSTLLITTNYDSLLVREVTKQGDNYIVSPTNNAFKPQIVKESDLKIYGRVVGLFKALANI